MKEITTLGDRRLDKRLDRLLTDLTEQPVQSLPQACGSWEATLAAYRFFQNPTVTPAGIVGHLAADTLARCRGREQVLVVQDTTSLDYTAHPRTTGLGVLEHPDRRGVFVQSSLAVDPTGVPLGLLAQRSWARPAAEPDPTDHRRHHLPVEGKETAKWLDDWQETATALRAQGATPILVADQEADIYEVYATVAALDSACVIRAWHDRAQVGSTDHLVATVEEAPDAVQTSVRVARRDQQKARTAQVVLRYRTVTIAPPAQAQAAIAEWWAAHPDVARLTPPSRDPVTLTVLLVTEPAPPPDVAPLRWLLLTNLPVPTPTAALRVVGYYRLRWLVERFHFVLKSGCRIEHLQLEAAERLMRAIAVYSGVAERLLWLTYVARVEPDAPCTQVVDELTWQALWSVQQPTSPLPPTPPSLRQFIRQVARLGGFLGRTRDGEPGVQTLWRGLRRLDDIVWTYRTLQRHPQFLATDSTYV